MNKKILILISAIIVIIISITLFIALKKDNKPTVDSYATSMSELNNAKEIKVTKDLVSLNKSFNILIDNKDFGTIDGEYINLTGDTLTFKDKHGTILSSEKQIKRWGIKLNRLAELRDNKDAVTGYIGEEKFGDLLKIGYNFHFYNPKKEEIGYSRQKVFSFLDTFKIYDSKDVLCYEINANFNPIRAEYTIKVLNNTVIPVKDAVYLTCILNSLKTAKKSKPVILPVPNPSKNNSNSKPKTTKPKRASKTKVK